MAVNIAAMASLGKLDLPTAFARMLDLLGSIDRGVKALQRSDPPPQGIAPVVTLELSSAGISSRQMPVEAHVVGILLGGDTTGRGTLQIGTHKLAFYQFSYQSNYIQFAADNPIVVRNDAISWNPPTGSLVWDTTIFYRIGRPNVAGATSRA